MQSIIAGATDAKQYSLTIYVCSLPHAATKMHPLPSASWQSSPAGLPGQVQGDLLAAI